MKKIKLLLLTLLGCFLMTSCYVTNRVPLQDDYNQAYKGQSSNEIITQFGAPDRQTDDGAGGRILIYEKTEFTSVATAENVNYYTGTYTPGSRTTANTTYLQFYINQDNICYSVKTNLIKTERYLDKKATRTSTIIGTLAIMIPIVLWAFASEM